MFNRLLSFVVTMLVLFAVYATTSPPVAAQSTSYSHVVNIWSVKTFATAVNRTDTSAWYNLNWAPWVFVRVNTVGTDSLKFVLKCDYDVAGATATSTDTVLLNFGAATTGAKYKEWPLRTHGSTSTTGAPLLMTEKIRLRAKLIPFRTADSTSATSYNVQLVLRY